MEPRRSFAASNTTYHSFHDIHLFEPSSPQKTTQKTTQGAEGIDPRHSSEDCRTTAFPMIRQDSGYGSNTTTPRASESYSRPALPSRLSTSSQVPRIRTRPSTRRSAVKSYHHQGNTSSVHLVRLPAQQRHSSSPSSTFFHFPSPDHIDIQIDSSPREVSPDPPQPPQTTHYWTSDRTRRLEYAAIDAASRGVKGWIRRNLVPDCFKEDQHLEFDDDSGSVRRYRLELEEDDPQYEKSTRRPKTWQFWSPKRSGCCNGGMP